MGNLVSLGHGFLGSDRIYHMSVVGTGLNHVISCPSFKKEKPLTCTGAAAHKQFMQERA